LSPFRSYQRQEVNTLRKASERLEDEVTKLKKQLANEKYERERLLQETTRRERDVTGSASRESLTSRYSRNTDQRLHTSFSGGEFARLKPKDMSSPLASDHSDSGRRIISPIRRRSDDDVSERFQNDIIILFTVIIQPMRWYQVCVFILQEEMMSD